MSEQLVTPENVTTKDGKINLLDLNLCRCNQVEGQVNAGGF